MKFNSFEKPKKEGSSFVKNTIMGVGVAVSMNAHAGDLEQTTDSVSSHTIEVATDTISTENLDEKTISFEDAQNIDSSLEQDLAELKREVEELNKEIEGLGAKAYVEELLDDHGNKIFILVLALVAFAKKEVIKSTWGNLKNSLDILKFKIANNKHIKGLDIIIGKKTINIAHFFTGTPGQITKKQQDQIIDAIKKTQESYGSMDKAMVDAGLGEYVEPENTRNDVVEAYRKLRKDTHIDDFDVSKGFE